MAIRVNITPGTRVFVKHHTGDYPATVLEREKDGARYVVRLDRPLAFSQSNFGTRTVLSIRSDYLWIPVMALAGDGDTTPPDTGAELARRGDFG